MISALREPALKLSAGFCRFQVDAVQQSTILGATSKLASGEPDGDVSARSSLKVRSYQPADRLTMG